MFLDYLRLIVFAFGLLAGVQVPNFVDQYAKRVSAHRIEVTANFRGFQDSADQYYRGDVDALIAHHTASNDQVFVSEASTIREMFARLKDLNAEQQALNGPLIGQIIHVAFHANRQILDETRREYTYTVPLTEAAIVSGVSIAAILTLLVEWLARIAWILVRPGARPGVRREVM